MKRRTPRTRHPAKRVRVTSRTEKGTVWASSLREDVSEETLRALDALADAVAAMTPEEVEQLRQRP